MCDADTGRCVGKQKGETCHAHEECDVRLACNPDRTFPFETTCKEMFSSGSCSSDFECDYTHFCYPKNPGNKSTECLELFSQPAFTVFGVIYDNTLTQLDNALIAGKYC